MIPSKDVFEIKLDFSDVKISTGEIGLSLGYSDGNIPEHFCKMVDGILAQISGHCEIKAGYRILDLKKTSDRNDGLYIGDKFFKMDKIVTRQLIKADKAAVFVCTIGPGMETWAKQLLNVGDPTMCYFVDTIASVTVESIANLLHDRLAQRMNELGLKVKIGRASCRERV